MVLAIKNFKILVLYLIVMSFFAACKKSARDWNTIAQSMNSWELYTLSENVKVPMPKKPISRKVALDNYNTIILDENNCDKDSITYSVNFISNSTLKDKKSWDDFLKNEVMAFKALEQKNIKLGTYDAVFSKVRENDLCALTLNSVIDSKYILNIVIRYKGEMPNEKMMYNFIKRIKF